MLQDLRNLSVYVSQEDLEIALSSSAWVSVCRRMKEGKTAGSSRRSILCDLNSPVKRLARVLR
jgi:hypothetical protein